LRYRKRTVNGRTYSEHRLVWEAANGPIPEGHHIHHRNGDKLDNRRENLRLCDRAGNSANRSKVSRPTSSKYKGVHTRKSTPGRWFTYMRINGKQTYIGTFKTEIDAAIAYDSAALTHFGAFACTNFPAVGAARSLFDNLKPKNGGGK